jgi:hypothetical protein
MKDVDTDVRVVCGIAREGKGCSLGEGSGTRGQLGASRIRPDHRECSDRNSAPLLRTSPTSSLLGVGPSGNVTLPTLIDQIESHNHSIFQPQSSCPDANLHNIPATPWPAMRSSRNWSGSKSDCSKKRNTRRKRRPMNARQQRLENARQPQSMNVSVSSSAHGQRPSWRPGRARRRRHHGAGWGHLHLGA